MCVACFIYVINWENNLWLDFMHLEMIGLWNRDSVTGLHGWGWTIRWFCDVSWKGKPFKRQKFEVIQIWNNQCINQTFTIAQGTCIKKYRVSFLFLSCWLYAILVFILYFRKRFLTSELLPLKFVCLCRESWCSEWFPSETSSLYCMVSVNQPRIWFILFKLQLLSIKTSFNCCQSRNTYHLLPNDP